MYADLTGLSEHERRAIFGLMVGNEGKSRIPVYDIYTQAGFDPDKDMLQAPVMPPEAYRSPHYPGGSPVPQWREIFGGGLLVDWDLRSNLEGLYAAGRCVYGAGEHAGAATGGRYAGRQAAEYARQSRVLAPDEIQVKSEKKRIYSPLKKAAGSLGWKELNAGICRIMQDYCGQYRNEEALNAGLRLFRELKEAELTRTYAANPHELERVLECHTIITVGEMLIHSSLARKASSDLLNFQRLDYPEVDPPAWHKLLPIRLKDGNVEVREVPLDWHLKAPYAAGYEENYEKHSKM